MTTSASILGMACGMSPGRPAALTTDPNWASSVLALRMNGSNHSTTFTDAAVGRTMTAHGGVEITTAKSRFGGSCGAFDGTGYLTTPQTANLILPQQFTVRGWVYLNAAGQQKFCGIWSDLSGGFSWKFEASGGPSPLIEFVWSTTGTNTLSVNGPSGAGAIPIGRWAYVEAGRDASDAMRLFINGTKVYEGTQSAAFFTPSPAAVFEVGRDGAGNTAYLNGYLQDLQVLPGVCVHTANYTPPWYQMPTA